MIKEIDLMYLRKSRADSPNETVEEVLERHERELQELAIRTLGHTIEEQYIFREVVSGETIEDRPEVQKILSRIERPNVKSVFCIEPQRLSRGDWEDGGKILSAFKYSHTLVHTVDKSYDLNNKFDYKTFKRELERGNDYLEYFKEIQARGTLRSVMDGNYISTHAPYGYDKIKLDKKSHSLVPNDNAKNVQLIFDLYVNKNMGWTAIGNQLESLGIKPPRTDHWNPMSIRDMLLNPVYIGMIRWNWRKTVTSYENGKQKYSRPRNNKEDIILVKGKHPAIIDEELFNKAQEKFGRNSKETLFKELKNPFSSLMYCASCGRAITYRTYSARGVERCKPRYLCINQAKCNTKSEVAENVMNSVIDALKQYIKDFEMKLESDTTNEVHEIYQKIIDDLNKELDKVAIVEDNLYEMRETGEYTKEVFAMRKAKNDQKREDLKARLKKAQETIPEPVDYEEKIYTFKQVLDTLKDENISAKVKNNLLKQIIDKIIYSNKKSDNKDRFASELKLEIFLK